MGGVNNGEIDQQFVALNEAEVRPDRRREISLTRLEKLRTKEAR